MIISPRAEEIFPPPPSLPSLPSLSRAVKANERRDHPYYLLAGLLYCM